MCNSLKITLFLSEYANGVSVRQAAVNRQFSFVSRVHYSRRSSCIVSHLLVIAGSDCGQVEGQREKETRGGGGATRANYSVAEIG